MTRGSPTFKKSDITRALRAARDTGAARVEIDQDGKISIVLLAPPIAPPAEDSNALRDLI